MRSSVKCAQLSLKVQFVHFNVTSSHPYLTHHKLTMGTSYKIHLCLVPFRTISRVHERVPEKASSHWRPWYCWTGRTSWAPWSSWWCRSSRSPGADGSQRPSRLLWASRRTGQERSISLFKSILHYSLTSNTASSKITKAAGISTLQKSLQWFANTICVSPVLW